jgi:WD40 repeat protein
MPSVSDRPAKTELKQGFQTSLEDYVVALEVSEDRALCVLGLGGGRVVGLDLASGGTLFSVSAHEKGLLGVRLAPDGERFITCGHEQSAKVWSREGKLLLTLPGGGGNSVECVAWAPKGNRIATASGKKVRVWRADGEPLLESEDLASTATGLVFRSDGSGLAASCFGGVHVFPFVEGAKARHLPWRGSLISLAWSPDGRVIACATQEKSVQFWRLGSGQDAQMSGYAFKPKALAWDLESRLLATSGDTQVTVWDFRGKGPEGTHPMELRGHQGLATCLAFARYGGILASGSEDTSVLLWEPRRTDRPMAFAFLEDEVTALTWVGARRLLLGADASGVVRAWHTP